VILRVKSLNWTVPYRRKGRDLAACVEYSESRGLPETEQ